MAYTEKFQQLADAAMAQVQSVSVEQVDALLKQGFNADPYYQQGGDMVRVGGLTYTCRPMASMGQRIHNMVLNDKPIDPEKTYKVAGWAPVSEEASKQNLKPIWEVAEQWLASTGGKVSVRKANVPVLEGVLPNAGFIASI